MKLSSNQIKLLNRSKMPFCNRYATGYRETTARSLVKLGLVKPTGFSGYNYSGIEITKAGLKWLQDNQS